VAHASWFPTDDMRWLGVTSHFTSATIILAYSPSLLALYHPRVAMRPPLTSSELATSVSRERRVTDATTYIVRPTIAAPRSCET
jgi:hypothetical protein